MLPDENAVSFNLQTTGALKQRKRAIELLEARELFKSVEWLVEAEQPSLSAQGFGNKAEVLLLNLVHGRDPSPAPVFIPAAFR